jgi:hypothetical protein
MPNSNIFLRYPYIKEISSECQSIVKRGQLYIQCDRPKMKGGTYCRVCNCGFNKINISDRIVGGFKNKKPISFDKITCFKKVLKKHGFNMTMLKKMAVKEYVTLNEDFIHEITKKQISRKKKKKQLDISVVDDTSDEEEETRGRGRPKKENMKDNNDLINDIINNNTDSENEEDTYDSDDDESDEIIVSPFNYTGTQRLFLQMSLYIDEYNVVYNNLGEILGTFNHDKNEIIDRLAIVSPEC